MLICGLARAVAALFACILLSGTAVHAQTTWYVDDDAALGGDGARWPTAFRYLRDALEAAVSGDEIRVAGGTYKPDQDEDDPNSVTPGDRYARFQLVNGVGLYGGYTGLADPNNPDARDIQLYETILSADLGGDDDPHAPPDPNDPARSDNSYHVVTGSGTDETAMLDGFTITGGNANGDTTPLKRGGGMYNHHGGPTLANCTFSGNTAVHYGGGMYNRGSSQPTLTNCTFSANRGGQGGGMCNENGSPTLTNCTFSGNSGGHYGGGIYNIRGSPTLINCTFSENSADLGGGVCNREYSHPTLINCTLSENSADDGGGMYSYRDSSPILTNCTFSGNAAANYGGGMSSHLASSHPPPANRTFGPNPAGRGAGPPNTLGGGHPTLTNCTFSGNSAGQGGAIANGWSNPTLINCILWHDTPDEIYDDPEPGTTATTTARYSDVRGGWPGEANIDADPNFVDPGNGDYQLLPSSPCINAGSNYAPGLPDEDIAGDPRVQFCRVDIGAYESPHPPASFDDCNDNGDEDDCDVYYGVSDDYDHNSVPDECDLDCNANGVPDACDVDCGRGDCASHPLGCGGSADCQPNGVPDECDIAAGTSFDFNGNEVPDECECLGDLNGDNRINSADLTRLLMNYGTTSGAEYGDGDINGDGDVDLSDLAALLSVYGTTCE